MFLDMKSSTTIAEELGHIRYFELLKEYYADLSDAIIQYAGEIGVLKKEIIFTGDVLNTTARIQGLCNTYGVDMLISEDLINLLALGPEYEKQSFGQNELRGRKKNMTLYTLNRSDA